MTSSLNNGPSAVSVCLERVNRGQQPKNFWSTSSSHDTQRRRPTWQSWSTATAAGSPRATGKNPAPMTQICEFSEDAVSHRILSTGSHVGDTDPISWSILAKISGWYEVYDVFERVATSAEYTNNFSERVNCWFLSGHSGSWWHFSPLASLRDADGDVDTCPMWTFPTVRPTSMNKLQKGYTHTDSEVGHRSAQLHTH